MIASSRLTKKTLVQQKNANVDHTSELDGLVGGGWVWFGGGDAGEAGTHLTTCARRAQRSVGTAGRLLAGHVTIPSCTTPLIVHCARRRPPVYTPPVRDTSSVGHL